MDINKIYNESCITTMEKRISDSSINLIITSPPYWVKKSYEKHLSYDEYSNLMESVFKQVTKILVPGGYAVFNFGDYFNSGNRFYVSEVPACYPAGINYYTWGVIQNGLELQATRIWRKQFSRMGIPFVCNSHPRPIFDYEHIWTFRKPGGTNKEVVYDRKLSQRGVIGEDWKSSAKLGTHCASFPIELPLWALQVYSKVGDLVYDPFLGAGTTALACIKLLRNYIGSELNTEYYTVAINNVKDTENR